MMVQLIVRIVSKRSGSQMERLQDVGFFYGNGTNRKRTVQFGKLLQVIFCLPRLLLYPEYPLLGTIYPEITLRAERRPNPKPCKPQAKPEASNTTSPEPQAQTRTFQKKAKRALRRQMWPTLAWQKLGLLVLSNL